MIALALLLSLIGGACAAATLRVPSEYPTIQAALDSVRDGDTVLVSVNTYAEALVAPPLSVVLKGDVVPDTGNYPRPVIDPSSLPRSDTLGCLLVPPQCSMVIEDFRFVNGPEMYPRPPEGRYPGGIFDFSELPLILRRCQFDSVYWGVDYGHRDIPTQVVVEDCEFTDMTGTCATSQGSMHALRCRVTGNNMAGIGGKNNVVVEQCQFCGEVTGGWSGFYGPNSRIENCTFGPGICHWTPVGIRHWGNSVVRNNVFVDIGLTGPVIDIAYSDGNPLLIEGNRFSGLYRYAQRNPMCVDMQIDVTSAADTSYTAIVRDNVFDHYDTGLGGNGPPKAVMLVGECELTRNRFVGLLPQDDPVIACDSQAARQRVHENVFIGNGFAARSNVAMLDARLNYWGDSTGPYDSLRNPQGLGDAVSDSVYFIPWYTDTSFLQTVRLRRSLPDALVMEISPNPFNSVATISYELPATTAVRLDVMNVLGQRVATLASGVQNSGRHEMSFDASDLASGIYFARLSVGPASTVEKLMLVR